MPDDTRRIPAYRPLCVSRCGCEAVVENGRLVALEPDPSHPTGKALCAKGRAAPEMIDARDRLLFPLRRTRPKGDPDPGWRRIGWDEALDETASALRRIADEDGPEAVAFSVTTAAATAISDAMPWIYRLINSFGSPNTCNGTEICSWHRQFRRLLHHRRRDRYPDYERAGCILLWGFNPSTSWLAAASAVAGARARGARLVVVDPRRVGLAVKADQWLPVRPGTDGAVALSIAGVMIEQGLVRRRLRARLDQWSVPGSRRRRDAAALRQRRRLRGLGRGARDARLRYDPGRGAMTRHRPGSRCGASRSRVATVRSAAARVRAFRCAVPRLPTGRGRGYHRRRGRRHPAGAHLLWHHRPVAYFTWTGLEQHANATHTARAHSRLYALTGCVDVPGGNVQLSQVPVNDISPSICARLISGKGARKDQRPLGTATAGW